MGAAGDGIIHGTLWITAMGPVGLVAKQHKRREGQATRLMD